MITEYFEKKAKKFDLILSTIKGTSITIGFGFVLSASFYSKLMRFTDEHSDIIESAITDIIIAIIIIFIIPPILNLILYPKFVSNVTDSSDIPDSYKTEEGEENVQKEKVLADFNEYLASNKTKYKKLHKMFSKRSRKQLAARNKSN